MPEFVERQARFRERLFSLQSRFKAEIPKFSPRYIGHMFSEVSLPALLGHMLTLLHNPNNISVESSQVGTAIENEALAALASMIGLKPVAKVPGHFTSGGTTANFEALVRARARAALWLSVGALYKTFHAEQPLSPFQSAHLGWMKYDSLLRSLSLEQASPFNFARSNPWSAAGKLQQAFKEPFTGPVVLIPENKHYSWTKGASLIGLGNDAIWPIKLDDRGRLCTEDLAEQLLRAESENRPVLLVVSVAGSTELGHFDPTHQVQDLLDHWSAEKGIHIWHHVDAAFGGFFCSMSDEQLLLLGEPAKAALRAIPRANSVTLDPHKLGYVPYSSGTFLARDPREYCISSFTAPYVQFDGSNDRGPYTLEGSRSAAGAVATWMIAQSVGLNSDGYGRILARTLSARETLKEQLLGSPIPIRIVPWSESNLLCFVLAPTGEPFSVTSERMERIYKKLSPEGDGPFFISVTRLNTTAYPSFLKQFSKTWDAKIDTEELTIGRICLMNPFFDSKETHITYSNAFVRALQDIHATAGPTKPVG